MKVLIFDTETTGLPDFKNPIIHTPRWYTVYPDIVQISWILYDDETNKLHDMKDFIVNIGRDIPEESSKIHGITTERMMKEGVPFQDILGYINDALHNCEYVVCHNLDFDKKTLIANMKKMGCINIFDVLRVKEFCTMKNSIDICKIKKYNYRTGMLENKWPRLNELHRYYFGSIPKNLHNSMNDVLVTLRCFHKMTKQVDIMDVSQEINKLITPLL